MYYAQFVANPEHIVGPFKTTGDLHEHMLSSYINHPYRVTKLVRRDRRVFVSTGDTWRCIGAAHREPKLVR